jgi:hypothetical protein
MNKEIHASTITVDVNHDGNMALNPNAKELPGAYDHGGGL